MHFCIPFIHSHPLSEHSTRFSFQLWSAVPIEGTVSFGQSCQSPLFPRSAVWASEADKAVLGPYACLRQESVRHQPAIRDGIQRLGVGVSQHSQELLLTCPSGSSLPHTKHLVENYFQSPETYSWVAILKLRDLRPCQTAPDGRGKAWCLSVQC